MKAVNYLKLIEVAVLATNLDSSALFLAVSAAVQPCRTSSGIVVGQMKIPLKSSGSVGVVLDLHWATQEQNLATEIFSLCSCCLDCVSMAQAVMEHPGGLISHRDLPFVFCQLAPAPLFLFHYCFKAKTKEVTAICL